MNLVIVASSLGVGMLPVVAPEIYEDFPSWFRTIFDSGISSAALVAILLNILFNHLTLGNSRRASVLAASPARMVREDELAALVDGDSFVGGRLIDADGNEVPVTGRRDDVRRTSIEVMPIALGQVVVDCVDAEKLATFWSRLLGQPLAEGASQFWAMIPAPADKSLPPLMFLQVENAHRRQEQVAPRPVRRRPGGGDRARDRSGSAAGTVTTTSTTRSGPPSRTRRGTCSTWPPRTE